MTRGSCLRLGFESRGLLVLKRGGEGVWLGDLGDEDASYFLRGDNTAGAIEGEYSILHRPSKQDRQCRKLQQLSSCIPDAHDMISASVEYT